MGWGTGGGVGRISDIRDSTRRLDTTRMKGRIGIMTGEQAVQEPLPTLSRGRSLALLLAGETKGNLLESDAKLK